MSAYIVSDKHIAALVKAAHLGRYAGETFSYYYNDARHECSDTELGQKLLDENYRSVNYRYADSETPRRYVHVAAPARIRPLDILKLLNGYDYQTCETPDYKQTEAYAIVSTLRGHAICALPGYDAAEWSLD